MEEKVINRPTRRDKQDFYNESIPFSELLVITDTGEKLGILTTPVVPITSPNIAHVVQNGNMVPPSNGT